MSSESFDVAFKRGSSVYHYLDEDGEPYCTVVHGRNDTGENTLIPTTETAAKEDMTPCEQCCALLEHNGLGRSDLVVAVKRELGVESRSTALTKDELQQILAILRSE